MALHALGRWRRLLIRHALDLAGKKSIMTASGEAGHSRPKDGVASLAYAPASDSDSRYAWMRLLVALALGTIGSVGMWSFVVALPAVQADFGIARGEASLPYTLTMIGFGVGGIVMGRLADRFGIVLPVVIGGILLGAGYVLSGFADGIGQFALAQGLLGFGSAATFGPLMSDISHWFTRRRGIAVALTSAATISREPFGRRSSSILSRPKAGVRPRSGSALFASPRSCRWCC